MQSFAGNRGGKRRRTALGRADMQKKRIGLSFLCRQRAEGEMRAEVPERAGGFIPLLDLWITQIFGCL